MKKENRQKGKMSMTPHQFQLNHSISTIQLLIRRSHQNSPLHQFITQMSSSGSSNRIESKKVISIITLKKTIRKTIRRQKSLPNPTTIQILRKIHTFTKRIRIELQIRINHVHKH